MKFAKIGVIVVVLAGIAWLGSRAFSASDDHVPASDHVNYYICTVCGTVQQLSDQQAATVKQYQYAPPPKPGEGSKPQGRYRGVDEGRTVMVAILCSKSGCGHLARPAICCPKDHEIYAAQADDGSLNLCPKCSANGDKPPAEPPKSGT